MSQKKSLYGLEYEFIQRDGNMLTLTKSDTFTNKDLSLLQLKMMEHNRIANLLPLYKEEMNEKVTLFYEFTGSKKLSQMCKAHPLTMEGCYKLLESIVSIVLDSKQYMLDEEHYVLDCNFIFTTAQYDKVLLCYLPVSNLDKPSFRQQFLELAMKLIAGANNSSESGLQILLKNLNDSNTTLLQLKQLLNRLAEEDELSVQETEAHQGDWVDDLIQDRKSIEAQMDKVNILNAAAVPLKESIKKDGSINYMKWGGTVLGAATLALLAVFYYHNPKEGILFICLGLGLLVVDVVYILSINWSEPARSTLLPAVDPQISMDFPEKIGIDDDREDLMKQHYKQLPQATTVLRRPDATVHLNKELKEAIVKEQHLLQASLEIHHINKMEEIKLTNKPYIIGRESEAVDYVLNTLGVSRMHCEISLNGEQYELKDLSSSNGTQLNDELLIPYRDYRLNNGDRIKIVECEMVFRMGD